MPRLLSPQSRTPVVLESDADAPPPRPTFYVRLLNGAEYPEFAEDYERLWKPDQKAREVTELRYDLARRGLVGWEHLRDPDSGQPIPFDPALLEQIVDPWEVLEIINAIYTGGRLTTDEKKPSASPPSSAPEDSADAAPPAAASNPPAKSSPPRCGVPTAKAKGADRAGPRDATNAKAPVAPPAEVAASTR